MLEERLGYPVMIDNDVVAAAVGEHWLGVAQDVGNYTFVYMGGGWVLASSSTGVRTAAARELWAISPTCLWTPTVLSVGAATAGASLVLLTQGRGGGGSPWLGARAEQ
jgi:hypothetical protein